MKTAEEILKDTLGDIRYGLNGNEMNKQIIHAMEMYLLQSSLPSPSLPSDEEGLMREILAALVRTNTRSLIELMMSRS